MCYFLWDVPCQYFNDERSTTQTEVTFKHSFFCCVQCGKFMQPTTSSLEICIGNYFALILTSKTISWRIMTILCFGSFIHFCMVCPSVILWNIHIVQIHTKLSPTMEFTLCWEFDWQAIWPITTLSLPLCLKNKPDWAGFYDNDQS